MTLPAGVSVVEEALHDGAVPLWVHPVWTARLPWLVQGTTGAGAADEPFDLGLFGGQPVGVVMSRWARLREATAMSTAVHARQVHGAALCTHAARPPGGLLVTDGYDGHLTDQPGVLLAVSVADCVPVFLVDPVRRAVAAVHAGWRGVAGGIVEGAVAALAAAFHSRPAELWLHCGPAICGRCYEVGPEVHAAVHPGREAPGAATPIDLRAAIVERAVGLGVNPSGVSLSAHCTRCGPGAFFSHRLGSAARQMGVLGRRG